MTTTVEPALERGRGQTAYGVVAELLRELTEILEVELLYLPVPPSVEGRPGATPGLQQHAAEARAGQPPGDSFTETFVAIAERHGDLASALDVIAFHQPLSNADATVRLTREQATEDRICQLAEAARSTQILVMTSRVRTRAGDVHIPMLDFKLPSNRRNTAVIELIARRLGGGFVLNSGSSYHLYGRHLMSDSELRHWLLRAQLLSRCVDTRWVTHQLIEGRAALRLGRGGGRGSVPRLLSLVDALV